MPRLLLARRLSLAALALLAWLAAATLIPSLAPDAMAQRVLIAYSDLVQEAERGQVADIRLAGSTITATFASGAVFTAYAPHDPGLIDRFIARGVRISAAPETGRGDATMAALTTLAASVAGYAVLALLLWLLVGRPLRAAASALQTIAKHAESPGMPIDRPAR